MGVFQPPTGHTEQWTVDPFWEMDRPTPVQSNQIDRPGPSSAATTPTSRTTTCRFTMEEGEMDSEADQDHRSWMYQQ